MTGDKPINRNPYENVDSYVDTLYPIDCGLGSNPLGAPEAVEEF